MHLVFWQNILSPHQAPFLRALANGGHDVTIVAAESMTEERLALGWKVPDHGLAKIVIAPEPSEIRRLIENSPQETIHVMAGARLVPLGSLAAGHLLKTNRRMGILTEAPDPRGIAGYGRWIKYTKERFTIGSRYDFILAMGEMGVRFFRRCGYPPRLVFPFAYVTEPAPALAVIGGGNKLRLLFVGRFIGLKGLDILLRAFAALPSSQMELRLLGEGPEQPQLRKLAQELGIQDRVIWLPKSDAAGVQAEMTRADVTILPSHKDGWGAVVNESLMVGTPVICSTACGAAELIREPWLGTVFRAGQVEELTEALQHWIDLGPRSQVERERIRSWANCITGESVAKYFVAVLEHVYASAPLPVAPWRGEGKVENQKLKTETCKAESRN